jgi:hypothetical protein
VRHLIEQPLDARFTPASIDEDPLDQLQKLHANTKNSGECSSLFSEGHANMPLKEYIRKWSVMNYF